MNDSFRKSMTWLHTWAGLVFCWILYFMFVTGTVGYFDNEIDRWMKPEVPVETNISIDDSVRVAENYLRREAPDADRWVITPAQWRETPHLRIFWQGKTTEETTENAAEESAEDAEPVNGNEILDINTGEPMDQSVRDTGGGQTLYRMHYILHYLDRDIAYRLVGVITMLMLVGIITGVVIHRKIFSDFFTFRRQKGPRAWLDMHNLMSISSLPFQLMITYSGLIFMVTVWMPGIAVGSYGFDLQKADEGLHMLVNEEHVERSGEPGNLVSLQNIVEKLSSRDDFENVRNFEVFQPGDTNAKIVVNVSTDLSSDGATQLVFDGMTGELIHDRPFVKNNAVGVAFIMISLHEGLFAGPFVRWLYFFSGLLGTGMIATGAIYWTQKRKVKIAETGPDRGYQFVESLNIGTIVGLMTALAAYFWANRLLPLGMEGRADWEVHCMFIIWGLCLLHPVFRPKLNAWMEQCWVASLAFLAIPIVNLLTTDAHLFNSLPEGDWVLAGFDIVAIATGIGFAIAALLLKNRLPKTQIVKGALQQAHAQGS